MPEPDRHPPGGEGLDLTLGARRFGEVAEALVDVLS